MFRSQGKEQLGDHFYELLRELDKFESGVELIVYGYDQDMQPRLFEVNQNGEIIDQMIKRYAIIGSGWSMASGALTIKPLSTIDFDSMMYRVLEAKFCSETAAGVGRTTTVTIKRQNQPDFRLTQEQIQKMRDIWERECRIPAPTEALKHAGEIKTRMQTIDDFNSTRKS